MTSIPRTATRSPGPRLRTALLGLLVLAALGTAPSAASAATLNLEAPTRVEASRIFTVAATGQADKDGFVYFYLQQPGDATACAATARAAQDKGAAPASTYEGQQVSAGASYSTRAQIASGTGGTRTLCAYLSERFDATSQAQASRQVNVVADSDGDGLYDDQDRCPDERGIDQRDNSRTADGCPVRDTDRDRIRDEEDQCPTQSGNTASGCPDSDGDGVIDSSDKCPTQPARDPATNQITPTADGCSPPDTDKDRIVDANDQCPLENAESQDAKKDPARPGCLESGFRVVLGDDYNTFTGRKKAQGTLARFIVQTTGFLRTKSFKVTVTLSAASAKKARIKKREIAATTGIIPATGESTFRDVFKRPTASAANKKKLAKLKSISFTYTYALVLANGETRKKTDTFTLKDGKATGLFHKVFGSGTNAGGEEG